MGDWVGDAYPNHCGVLSTVGPECSIAQYQSAVGAGYANVSAWPSANLALYVPVRVGRRVTVYQMSWEVGAQNGNCDVGIYTEDGTRLVSAGSTAVGAAGLQVFNITDTVLGPGMYYLASVLSTVTTATILSGAPPIPHCRLSGCRQQATALPLPATATFANYGVAYVPRLSAHYILAGTP
jgi:hypothetical protein